MSPKFPSSTRTAEVRVEDFVAVQEVGKVINPVLAAGQIEGGVAQGIGFALYENVVWKEGRMMNGQMTNYIMPTSMDIPPIPRFLRGNSVRAAAPPAQKASASCRSMARLPRLPTPSQTQPVRTSGAFQSHPEVLLEMLEGVHV